MANRGSKIDVQSLLKRMVPAFRSQANPLSALWWGMCGVVCFLLALLALDGYLFYAAHMPAATDIGQSEEPVQQRFSVERINSVIHLLDAEDTELQKILHTAPPPLLPPAAATTTATTSTSL